MVAERKVILMANISIIEPKTSPLKRKKKVAAYARVSLDTERLHHSLSAQVSYYSSLIQNNPEWEYAGVFADLGISGTGMKNRSELQRLLVECEKGNVDIILTKSISRFARNTVDLLETVRHLKDLGIEVRFEKENINSLSGDGELMLSLLASFAQEESRSISENCKWGIRKRFQSGEIGTTNKHMLGYQYDEKLKKYIIIPEEAESVRWMFQMFIDGVSYRMIAKNLNDAGVRSVLGNEFSIGTVRQLIYNEVYAGHVLRQKTYIADPLKKNKVKNNGILPQYYMPDTHEAIIDKETYEKVLKERETREANVNPTYCFTKKIHCGVCGRNYARHKSLNRGKQYIWWMCRRKKDEGKGCISRNYRESDLKEICSEVLEIDEFDEEYFNHTVKDMVGLSNGDIQFNLIGGDKKLWKMPPKPIKEKPIREIIRPKNLFDGKIFCGRCGRRYGRSKLSQGGLIWRCRSKTSSSAICDSVNYRDDEIRKVYCQVFERTDFDEDDFLGTVEKIVIQEYGSINFHLKGGGIKHFETLKLRSNTNHITTETDAFINKLICASCRKPYRRYKGYGKYVYWVCSGTRTKIHCENRNAYGDYDLRKITAYILGTDGYDEQVFLDKIERIEAESDGSLTYYFYGGGMKKWQKM